MSDLPILPDINFVETDAQAIIDDIISGYEQASGRQLTQADPVRLFLLSLAYVIVQQRQQIDAAGKSTTLYYAQGDFLDHIGAMRMTERLPAVGAMTTVRFSLSQERPTAIGIPQGTRVTADGEVFWATTSPATIPSGQLYVDVKVQCLAAGIDGNDVLPGQITELVDPIPFVDRVENIDISQGGQDRESDNAYRERIYRAPAAFSVAGPKEAYEYWAYTASQAISHAVALTPSPGVAEVRVLLKGGEIPDQAILDTVYDALSSSTVRPLADKVEVKAPDVVNYALNMTYYIRRADQGSLAQIQERIEGAVTGYIAWQRERIGRDINPDELIARVKAAGAKRVEIATPAFQAIESHQVAQDTSVHITYGGAEDE